MKEKEQLQATVRQLEAEALDRSVARDQDDDRAALQEEVQQLQAENQVSALCSAACPCEEHCFLKSSAGKDLHGCRRCARHCHARQHASPTDNRHVSACSLKPLTS